VHFINIQTKNNGGLRRTNDSIARTHYKAHHNTREQTDQRRSEEDLEKNVDSRFKRKIEVAAGRRQVVSDLIIIIIIIIFINSCYNATYTVFRKKVIYLFFFPYFSQFLDKFYETSEQWRKHLAACVSA